jgi:hypothetical protein
MHAWHLVKTKHLIFVKMDGIGEIAIKDILPMAIILLTDDHQKKGDS